MPAASAAPRGGGLKPIHFFRPLDGSAGGERPGVKPVDASRYVTFSYQGEDVVDEARFKRFIAGLPWELFRIKGPVRFPDRTEVLNFVGGQPDWVPWVGPPRTCLAFIGWDVNAEETLHKLKACLV